MNEPFPAMPTDLFVRLTELNISSTTLDHPAAHTVEELAIQVGHLPGVHIKNLFFADAKKKMWLVVAPADLPLDLKKLADVIGAGRLSFGSPERLMRVLGVTPGSVTPFAVINDHDRVVQLVLDAGMMQADIINAHPLINTMTTAIKADDLVRFVEACGHPPRLVDLTRAKP